MGTSFGVEIEKEVLIVEWFFDGIGTEIVSIVVGLVIGAVSGGTVGYKIGINRTASQKQIAGNDSKQKQKLQMGKSDVSTHSTKSKTNLKQTQKAGDNAVQTQIGGINDDRG